MRGGYVPGIRDFSGGIHFVGIGGVGMSGIAEVLLSLDCRVQGSDIVENPTAKRLCDLGAEIFIGHCRENIEGAEVVVVSSAIDPDNPEILEARARKIPIIKRAEMLSELMRFRFGIAVAGTHGKTTTTSLVSAVLSESGLDPTYVIGGKVESFGGHAMLGKSEYLVVEADESDASFLHLNPMLAVITNIDADHLGAYQQSFDSLVLAFAQFLENLPFYGSAVVCNEDPVLRQLQRQVPRRFLTYGFTEDCDLYAYDLKFADTVSQFKLSTSWGDDDMSIRLNLPGRHNILNALAAFGVGHLLQIDAEKIHATLEEFQGIARRFQNYGDMKAKCGTITIIDDYGHHPTEITATYDASCEAWPERRKVVVFQPHRYTRLHTLFDEFVEALAQIEQLILLDVYAAGEQPIADVSSDVLCRSVAALSKNDPIYISDSKDIPAVLDEALQDGDVVIMMGAGSIGVLARDTVQRLRQSNAA